jgi:hypothetical protein
MQKIKDIAGKLIKKQFVYNMFIHSKMLKSDYFKKMTLKYNPDDLNLEYYNKIKNSKFHELEHQIGRLTNFKNIIKLCASLEGDIVEFGCYRGFSILWIAYLSERIASFKKIIGLDGFIGLPYGDDKFRKGRFSDTTAKKCLNNIIKSDELYEETKRNIYIGKFLYEEKGSILKYFKKLKIDKFCFIHIDCDVSQSAREIFDILIEGNLIADECYILYDDYGIENKLRDVINGFNKKMEINWNIEEHSKTKFTKNFFLQKR